jgi:hypothetical protein
MKSTKAQALSAEEVTQWEAWLNEAEPLLEATNSLLEEVGWLCAACYQPNTLLLETLEGEEQQHVADCSVCCHANQLLITRDLLSEDTGSQSWQVSNELLGA